MMAISIKKMKVCTRGCHEKCISMSISVFEICHGGQNVAEHMAWKQSRETHNSPVNVFAIYRP